MRAAVLHTINEPLRVAEVGLTPLQFGQVQVRVLVSGICGAQLQEIRGHKGNAGHVPHLLGHEGCGIVEEVGPGVSQVKPGDQVVMHWRKGAGVEADFPTYVYDGHFIRSGKVTTLSEKAIVSENRLTVVDAGTPPELCALLGCGLSTALCTVEHEANIKFAESVLIVGTGGLGANLIKASVLANACPIVAMDVHESKRRLALDMGAHFFVLANSHLEGLMSRLGLRGFDVILDTAGTGASMERTLPFLNASGRYFMIGQPEPGKAVSITNAKHLFDGEGKSIKATQGGGFRPEVDIPRYVKMHRMGLLKVGGLITERIGLEDINRGLDMVRNGQASRIIVDMRA